MLNKYDIWFPMSANQHVISGCFAARTYCTLYSLNQEKFRLSLDGFVKLYLVIRCDGIQNVTIYYLKFWNNRNQCRSNNLTFKIIEVLWFWERLCCLPPTHIKLCKRITIRPLSVFLNLLLNSSLFSSSHLSMFWDIKMNWKIKLGARKLFLFTLNITERKISE